MKDGHAENMTFEQRLTGFWISGRVYKAEKIMSVKTQRQGVFLEYSSNSKLVSVSSHVKEGESNRRGSQRVDIGEGQIISRVS